MNQRKQLTMASNPPSEIWNSLHETRYTTTLKREIFSFVWCIDQFGEFVDWQYEFSSPVFTQDTPDATKWRLVAFPENAYPEGMHVTLRLLKAWDDNKSCSTKYTISIIDNNGKIFQQKIREKVFRHHLDSDDCLIASNKALKQKLLQQNGTLIISCNIDMVKAKNPDDSFPETVLPSQDRVTPINNLSYAKASIGSVEYERNIANLSDLNTTLLKLSAEKKLHDTDDFKTPKSLELLSDDLKYLYMNKTASDITLRTDDGEIRAHKAILMTRSDYFKRIQISPYNNDIYIPGIKSITLDAVLYYLYTGQLRHLTFEFALDLLEACNTLNLNLLQNMIENYLKTQINVNNVTDIFRISKELNMDSLKNSALKFVSANHSEVANTEKWNQMIRNNPHAAGEVLLTVASFKKNRKW